MIELPSGRIVHPLAVKAICVKEPNVRQYQIVQRSATRFTVNVVVDPTADGDELSARLAAAMSGQMGSDVGVDVCLVDAIDRTASGKSRTFLSHLHKPAEGAS